jgi:hypothetical protein
MRINSNRNKKGQFVKGEHSSIRTEFKKGQLSHNKGKHLSSETKEKISKSKRGAKLSEETRKKISISLSGERNPFYGKHHTEETKLKISKLNKGKSLSEETKKKISNANKGEKHYNWISDRNKLKNRYHSIRLSNEMDNWRKQIFERDNWTCQICGKIGGTLNAHHIKLFSKYPEEKFNIDNGITLCKDCHLWTHYLIGKK